MVGPLNGAERAVPDWMVEGGFELRPLHESDRDEVLAITAHTWQDGDYIPEVYDEWLADREGIFAALVHTPSGRIAAIDKVSMLAPGQAWFEGLRVNPDFRGQGISGKLQTHMVGVVRGMGARVVRFLTLNNNTPIHIAAYRDGFHIAALTRYWRWKPDMPPPLSTATMALRPAGPGEALALHNWWTRTAGYPTAGLLHRRWTFYEGSSDEWAAAAQEGRLLVEADARPGDSKLPPAAVMWNSWTEEGMESWQVAATLAEPRHWAPLYTSLLGEARRRGAGNASGMFADTVAANAGLSAAGMTPDPDEDRLYLFELHL
jgi:GNAT superfamily N-acetyltransferase